MKNNRRPRRVIVLAAALAVAGGGGAALVLAGSAGAATSVWATAAHTHSPHAVPMAPPAAGPARRPSPAAAPAPVPAQIRAVQLSAAQLPAAATQKWTPVGTPSTRAITGHGIRENECASVRRARTWTQQGFSGDRGQTAAIQDTFAFASSAAAQAAYQGIVTAMARCEAVTRAYQRTHHVPADAVVTQTASRAHSLAWERKWTGVLGMSAAGPQANHFYLAALGRVLIVMQFTEFPGQTARYDAGHDPQVLAMLDTELAR
jgi:hypothetical protein